ncbi:MAG: IS1182 family transposase [Chloroflexi bacterium]|nr:IS1182 family transposase [Chloroflexota bacterium]
MAYRHGDRRQNMLLPASIEQYVPHEAPVRAYDAFVDSLDFEQLGIKIEPDKAGCPQYDPKAMLKLLVYGYSYGVRSSRKLERESHYNLSFIWLTGGMKPDHKTIAEFRRRNKAALSNVLRQCAMVCIELGLIEGNTLFVDGSKMRANAGINNSWNKDKCLRRLEQIDNRIAQVLSDCEQADQQEVNASSLVKMQKELADTKDLRGRVQGILHQLNVEDKKSLNTTDSDCTKIHGRQGSHAGYNAQTVVDEKHGLIVSSDVVNENNDLHQFAKQINKAEKTLENKPEAACADAGYSSIKELAKIDSQDIKVIVPSSRQASGKPPGPFDRCNFKYDKDRDIYICPEGKILRYTGTDTKKGSREYCVEAKVCKECRNFGLCTISRYGRGVNRKADEELAEKLAVQYEQPQSQKIYELRKQKAELPFGHIKHNLKVDGFLLRGLAGVKAEMAILASCFNIVRMINIIGVSKLVTLLDR